MSELVLEYRLCSQGSGNWLMMTVLGKIKAFFKRSKPEAKVAEGKAAEAPAKEAEAPAK